MKSDVFNRPSIPRAAILTFATLIVPACNETPILGEYANRLSGGGSSTETSNRSTTPSSSTSSAADSYGERNSSDPLRAESCDTGGAEVVEEAASGHINVHVCRSKESLSGGAKGPSEVMSQIAGSESDTYVVTDRSSDPDHIYKISIPLRPQTALAEIGLLGALIIQRDEDEYKVWLGSVINIEALKQTETPVVFPWKKNNRLGARLEGTAVIEAIRFKSIISAPASMDPLEVSLSRDKAEEYFGSFIDELDAVPDSDDCKANGKDMPLHGCGSHSKVVPKKNERGGG